MGRKKQVNRLDGEALRGAIRNGLLPGTHPFGTADVIRFALPPSGNNLFQNARRGRVKTAEYREWIAAHEDTARQLKPPSKYPVRMCFRLCGKVYRARDGFNCEKPLTDILVSVNVLEKDSLMCVTGGRWEYAPSDEEPHVLVWLEEV